jgi:hypothetical protein
LLTPQNDDEEAGKNEVHLGLLVAMAMPFLPPESTRRRNPAFNRTTFLFHEPAETASQWHCPFNGQN